MVIVLDCVKAFAWWTSGDSLLNCKWIRKSENIKMKLIRCLPFQWRCKCSSCNVSVHVIPKALLESYPVWPILAFLILLVTHFLTKVAQILWLIFGLFEIIQLSCKNDLATVWALLEKWASFLFYLLVTLVISYHWNGSETLSTVPSMTLLKHSDVNEV